MFLSRDKSLALRTGRGDLFCMYKIAQNGTEIMSVMFVINSHDPAVMTSLSGDRKIARRFRRFNFDMKLNGFNTVTIVKVRCLNSHAGTFFIL